MVGWRRYSEAVLQRAPSLSGKTFRATSNARNEAMFKEATEFALSIKVLEKDLKALLKNTEVHFKNLRCILVSPLPRVYDEGPLGVQALDEETRLLGANMEVEDIPRAADVARSRIEREVLSPLREWTKIYKDIMERMKMLEALRLELDSRRRTVSNLQGKLERVRSTLGSTRHKGELELKETEDTMARKHDKMENTFSHFVSVERTVYNSLYTLVRDTAVLRDYTLACLKIMMEAFESAVKAYDTPPTTQLSTNNASGMAAAAAAGGAAGYQPENKYEAQLPAADRPTPKGIGALIDRLRGKPGTPKAPPSPASMRDAHEHNDQLYGGGGYGMGYGPQGSQRGMPSSGYGMGGGTAGLGTQNGSSMRPTHESDVPPPSAYAQPGLHTSATANYATAGGPSGYYGQQQQQQQLATGGGQYGGAAPTSKYPYQAQVTGGSNGNSYGPPGSALQPQQSQQQQRAYPNADAIQPMPSMRVQQPDAMQQGGQYPSRYAPQPQQQMQQQHLVGGTGWTTDGY